MYSWQMPYVTRTAVNPTQNTTRLVWRNHRPQWSFFFFFPRNSGGTSKHGLPFQAKLSCAFSDIMTLQFHACFSSVKEKKSAMEFYFSTQGSNLVSLSTCSPMFFLRRKSVGTFHKKKRIPLPHTVKNVLESNTSSPSSCSEPHLWPKIVSDTSRSLTTKIKFDLASRWGNVEQANWRKDKVWLASRMMNCYFALRSLHTSQKDHPCMNFHCSRPHFDSPRWNLNECFGGKLRRAMFRLGDPQANEEDKNIQWCYFELLFWLLIVWRVALLSFCLFLQRNNDRHSATKAPRTSKTKRCEMFDSLTPKSHVEVGLSCWFEGHRA